MNEGGRAPAGRVDRDLDLGVGVDRDVEDLAVAGEPGVGPAPVVADADRGDAVDDGEGSRCGLGHVGPDAGELIPPGRVHQRADVGYAPGHGGSGSAGGAGARDRQPPHVLVGGDRGVLPRRRRHLPGRGGQGRPAPRRAVRHLPLRPVARAPGTGPGGRVDAALDDAGHRSRPAGPRPGRPRPGDTPLPGDHPGGRPPARPPAARRHDGPVRPLGDDRHPPRDDRGAADALVGPPRLAAPRGHDDHPRRHRGGRAPARGRHRARDGRGPRPGGAPGRRRTAGSRRAAPSSSASPTSCPTTSRAPS